MKIFEEDDEPIEFPQSSRVTRSKKNSLNTFFKKKINYINAFFCVKVMNLW